MELGDFGAITSVLVSRSAQTLVEEYAEATPAGQPSFCMTGMGGNRVHVLPGLDLVVAVTSANFGRSDAHEPSDCLVEQVPAITVQ
jgi:hypothetical protein